MDLTEKQELAAFKALYRLHSHDASVLLADGILHRVTDNAALRAELSEDELAFYQRSLDTFEYEIRMAIDAQTEGNDALIHAEQRAVELEQAKAEAEAERAKAQTLAKQIEIDRDELVRELEQTAMLQLHYDRMRWQFQLFSVNAPWAWGLLSVFLMGIFVLMFLEKPGVDVLVPVLAAVLGAKYGAFAQSMGSLYTPMMKDDAARGARRSKKEINDL